MLSLNIGPERFDCKISAVNNMKLIQMLQYDMI